MDHEMIDVGADGFGGVEPGYGDPADGYAIDGAAEGYGAEGGYDQSNGYHEGGEGGMMDMDDMPVTQEDAWAVIRYVL